MNPSDDFQRKIDAILAVQALHDERIQALIRAAEQQQKNLDQLDDTVASLAESMIELRESHKATENHQRYLDERVDRLVSAIGEFVRKQN